MSCWSPLLTMHRIQDAALVGSNSNDGDDVAGSSRRDDGDKGQEVQKS